MTEIVSLVTSIAACLSAIAALVVVRQNYKQRTASYRPELVLVKTTIRLRSFEETGGFPQVSDENSNSHVSIPMVNVGLGAAKDVKISWEFPVDQVVLAANRLAQGTLTPVSFEYEHGRLSMHTEIEWMINWSGEKQDEIDYVLPAPIQHDPPSELRVPLTYVALIAGLHHFAFKSRASSFPDVPPLECRLDYTDIGGAEYGMDLLIHMKAFMISNNEFGAVLQSSRCDVVRRGKLPPNWSTLKAG